MARTIDTTRTAERILALRRTARRGGDVQDELEPIIEDLRGDLDDTMSKSQAAKVIGVSVPTLDKWIADPNAVIPGNGMSPPFGGVADPAIRAKIIAYLKTL